MKRKLLSFALVLAMVLAIFPVSAFATYDNGDFRYEIALRDTPEESFVVIAHLNDPNRTSVEIPKTIDGITVREIDICAFQDTKIQSIDIPETIVSIGEQAFRGCRDLKEVNFEGDSIELGERCFENCTSLESIWVPACGIVPKGAFRACSNLTAAVIDEGSYIIDQGAFECCDSLKYIYIPTSMDVIYTAYTFRNVTDLVVAGIPGYKELSAGQALAEKMGFTFQAVDYPAGENAVFPDVDGGHYYSLPVLWAATNGITMGMTDGTFRPQGSCTRAEMITFIWRFCGSPEPDPYKLHTFTDVAQNRYYYNAVQWGYQTGIIKGMSDSEFQPDATVTRAMAVTMLHRLDGGPAASGENSFTDVSQNSYYDGIQWAQGAGVAWGYGDGTFRPDEACTRGMIVTFLHRNVYAYYRSMDPDGEFIA